METSDPSNQDSFFAERQRMVKDQIRARNVTDERVLEAMLQVRRHEFVPTDKLESAYDDYPLAIGENQTISQPYIVALMTELAALNPGDKVLDVGTGCGYQAAILYAMAARVYTIEILQPLFEQARKRLLAYGFKEDQFRHGDGYNGWPEQAQFDAILVAAATDEVPPELKAQLAPGGRLILPIGPAARNQDLIIIEKDKNGALSERAVIPVRFVPLTRMAV